MTLPLIGRPGLGQAMTFWKRFFQKKSNRSPHHISGLKRDERNLGIAIR